MPEDVELDTAKLEEEVAKLTGTETPASETTTEEKPKEEPSETRTDTSLKTEEPEVKKEEEKVEDEETRFDKHPRWQQLKQQRDEALEKAREAEDIKARIGDIPPERLLELRQAAEFLQKHPDLAEKLQKEISEYPYARDEVDSKINTVLQKTQDLEERLILKEYDEQVDKLVSESKVDKNLEPLVREVFDNRVINQKIPLKDVPKAFEKALKDVDSTYRKMLASYSKSKEEEPGVPKSPEQKGKVITSQKKIESTEDVISALAEGIKASSAELPKE